LRCHREGLSNFDFSVIIIVTRLLIYISDRARSGNTVFPRRANNDCPSSVRLFSLSLFNALPLYSRGIAMMTIP
jgi:hypothetical protein